jgi:TonB family protein
MLPNSFLLYFYESVICLAIFYLFYHLLLRKEKIYTFNRIYLTGSLLFSSLLPFLRFPVPGLSDSHSLLSEFVTKIGYPVIVPEVSITQGIQSFTVLSLSWTGVLTCIYFIGVIFFLSRFLTGIIRIFFLVRKNEIQQYQGRPLVFVQDYLAPFSFFKLIFINPSLLNQKHIEKIIEHETAHIKQFHTIDLLFTELLTSFIWINPMVWFVKRSLKETHEYLADRYVTKNEENVTGYQTLLLNLISGRMAFQFTNHFNKSMLKKRIMMMTTKSSIKFPIFKALVIVPVMILVTWIFACNKTENDIIPGKEKDVTDSEIPQITYDKNSVPVTYKGAEVFFAVEEMPKFQGQELENFRHYIGKNLKYPEYCSKNKISGKVFIEFIVDYNGEVSYAKVKRSAHPDLDAEALRVVRSSPVWEPGKQRGKAVNVMFTFPINFVLE